MKTCKGVKIKIPWIFNIRTR